MNKRIRLTIIFSADTFPYASVLEFMTPRLSQLFAGACCQPIDGIWSEDGEEDKSSYHLGQQESGMKVILSIMPDKIELAQQHIQQLLQELKDDLNIAIKWVHVEQEEVTAHHFKLR
ncbi:hypothetical protein [Echinimonas agarilytica]|uniref:Uncharacterized protein n=1 Tax=Echinimonas agarilytica TaxID=1215918 RepID=A0AA41W8D3_9GAMM|nr:hypothetical protein [Echinimonas agarilytica]MCM2680825.1 hypothetical protein [Echinimonas agarilytica]